ncbi:MAG: hypothetical protein Fur003_2940 [Candidatus Dojkabacteria bacterium]
MPLKKIPNQNIPYIIAAILTIVVLTFSYVKMTQIAEYNHDQTFEEAKQRLNDLQTGKIQEESEEEQVGE